MLKAKLTSLDGVSESDQAHYAQRDGAFFLSVEAVDGYELEDVAGLRKVLDEVKDDRTKLKGQLSELDSTLSVAKLSINELESTQDAKAKDKMDKYQLEVKELHQKELSVKEDSITGLKQEVEGLRLNDVATRELINAGFTTNGIELVMPILKKSTNMVGGEGGHRVEVVNEFGKVRSGTSGADMTIAELCAELAPKFPELVKGSGSSGAGANGGSGTPPVVGERSITASEIMSNPKAAAGKFIDVKTGEPLPGKTEIVEG